MVGEDSSFAFLLLCMGEDDLCFAFLLKCVGENGLYFVQCKEKDGLCFAFPLYAATSSDFGRQAILGRK